MRAQRPFPEAEKRDRPRMQQPGMPGRNDARPVRGWTLFASFPAAAALQTYMKEESGLQKRKLTHLAKRRW